MIAKNALDVLFIMANAHQHPPGGPTARAHLSAPGREHDVVEQSMRSWHEFARVKQFSSEAQPATPTLTAKQAVRRNAPMQR